MDASLLKKYSRWQKAMLKIELQECVNELKKTRTIVSLENNDETMDNIDENVKNHLKL